MAWKILLYALISYVTLLLIIFCLQRQLLYLPGGLPLSESRALELGLRAWPSAERFRGFTAHQDFDDAQGTVIIFHGNAGAAYHRAYYVKALSRLGLRVILAEYPGYGGRAGRPSEDALVSDALESIRLAYQSYGEPLYVWGESLGAGVVSGAVARTETPLKGVVLFLPWDSLPRLAQTHYWFLPARWLVRDTYDNIDNLRHFTGRVAVILAEDDEVIPVPHGQKLYDAISARKRLWVFEDATHNEMPVEATLGWWTEVVAFISE